MFTMECSQLYVSKERLSRAVTLHVTLNVIPCMQPKHSRCTYFPTVMMSKLTYFKPPSSNDVTKTKDTFNIE